MEVRDDFPNVIAILTHPGTYDCYYVGEQNLRDKEQTTKAITTQSLEEELAMDHLSHLVLDDDLFHPF